MTLAWLGSRLTFMGYRGLSRLRERLRLVVPWLREWNTTLRSLQP